MFRTLILTGLSVVALSSAAFAADPQTKPAATTPPAPAATTTTTADTKDFDPVICRRQEEIGTRLGTKTVCKPRSEWNEDKRINREMVGNGGRMTAAPQ
jgi:hypothetical protein